MLMVESQGTAMDDNEDAGGKNDEAGEVGGDECPDAYSDDNEMNEMPSKKTRMVMVPTPVMPPQPLAQKPTATQKQKVNGGKAAMKAAEKVAKAAECEAKAVEQAAKADAKMAKEAARVAREADKRRKTQDWVVNQPEIEELTRALMAPTDDEATRADNADGRDKKMKEKEREMRGMDIVNVDKHQVNHDTPVRQQK